MKLKEVFDTKCKFRISDFEKAQVSAAAKGLRIIFSEFIYHDGTKFIWKVVGIVNQKSSRIRIEWDYAGRAYIGNDHFSEFDLDL